MTDLAASRDRIIDKIDRVFADEAILRLRKCQANSDTEAAHGEADDIICTLLDQLGFGDVVVEWEQVDKWYA